MNEDKIRQLQLDLNNIPGGNMSGLVQANNLLAKSGVMGG